MTAPTITGLTTSVTFGENTVNAAPQIIDSDVTVSDAEGDFDGGALTVSGHFGGDSISVRDQGTGAGQIGLSGGTITYGGTAIGTATGGGAGAKFVVTFNANATTAAVEALIENLTYANSNNVNPAASRTLKIVLTDGGGEGQFAVRTGSDNPLDGVDVGFRSAPAFGDLDGDGDLDMVSGESNGTFLYFKNTGTASAPVYVQQSGADNPLNGFDVGLGSTPALVDIDGDGDLDLVSTENDGNVNYFENTGTASAPVFVERTGVESPFNGIVPTNFTKPAFADVDGDGDGDKDMLLGTHTGSLLHYRNTGSATAPVFVQQGGADNPFDGINAGSYTAPAFGDVDGDGDLDLVVGKSDGTVSYFENTGSATVPSYVERTGAASPFNGIDVGSGSVLTLADIDGDSDLDLVIGNFTGTFTVAENTTHRVKVNVFTENDAPVAEDASFSVGEGGSITAAVPAATDVDGTIASYVLDSAPAKGSVSFRDNGNFNYDAEDAFETLGDGESEQVTFTYHAVDNSGASSAAKTVTITVSGANDMPEFGGLAAAITFAENTVNATPRLLDASVTVADKEGNIGGGSLTVSGLLAEDIVSINDQGTGSGMIGFSGGVVTFEGVAIGTATGGQGSALVVTFNQNVTTAIVEALVENLTYANSSDTPTASRTLAIAIADASGGARPVLDAQTGTANPFNGIKHGDWNTVAFGDLDGDGDLDLVTGSTNSGLHTYRNTGTDSAPVFTELSGTANPFNGLAIGNYATPALVDLDGDGDLDAVVGANGGALAYFENTGTATAAVFTARTGAANPFDGLDFGDQSTPVFADMDGDGDLDLVAGNVTAGFTRLDYLENTGSAEAPAFTARTGDDNPFDGIAATGRTNPALGDFDGDGDLDLALGSEFVGIRYYQNTGSATDAAFIAQAGAASPFHGVFYGPTGPGPGEVYTQRAVPAFADLDADGDLDAVVGHGNGIAFAENTGHAITVNVTAENDLPVASDGSAETDEAAPVAGVVTATDLDGTIASYVLDSDVAKGALTFNGDGTFTFDPDGDFDALGAGDKELVTFTWHAIDDGGASSAVGTVTVTVTGTVPVIEDIAASVIFTESAVNSGPQLLDADVTVTDAPRGFDGGSLTVSGLLSEDTVSVRNEGAGAGQIGFSGGTVSYGGVAIGTAVGGSGTTFAVIFNASATAEAIEALAENLTYANGSDTPTASRTFSISLDDGTTGFLEAAGPANPFAGINLGNYAAPTLADVDGDGDLDLIAGNSQGLSFFENTGTATDAVFAEVTGAENPFNGLVGSSQSPVATLIDIDDDGDLDLVVGTFLTPISYFENTGTATDPTFAPVALASSPFAGITSGLGMDYSAPAFADIDGDGDADLVIGTKDGTLHYYENVGSASAAAFTERTGTDNPFHGIDVGEHAKPAFADLDGDGDLDLVVGDFDGTLHTFANGGNATAPGFSDLTGGANPFDGVDIASGYAAPTFADMDGDGDLDLVAGSYEGGVTYLANSPAARSEIAVTVVADNDAPVASNSTRTTDEDTARNGQVPEASDADGTIAGYVLDSDVAKGALVFDTDGFYSFDPDGDFEALGDGETEEVNFTYHAVDDAGAASAVRTVTITVTGVNDAPALTDLANSATFAENTVNAAPQRIDSDVVLVDPEGNFDGGTVTVTGLLGEDIVSVRDQGTGGGEIGFSGGIVTYGGVAVGTATGGDGDTFTVTLNADATSAAVEALIQNLTYANTSDTPTASRTLTIGVTDGAGASMPTAPFTDRTGAANPFAGIDLGDYSAPAFADLDGDGDLDLVVGVYGSGLHAFENAGAGFVALTGADNPFDGISIDGGYATPSFADIDGDGDLDLVVGSYGGEVHAFENTGTGYVELTGTDNPFDGINPGRFSAPAFGDFDGDGDLDLILGAIGGQVHYHENTGTATAPVFTERSGSANPFDGVDIGNRSIPAVSDVDGDGDLDVLLGERDGELYYIENAGTATVPNFVRAYDDESPFNGFTTGRSSYAAPAFADIDGDGDMDLAVGHDGQIRYIEKSPSTQITIHVTAENDLPVAAASSKTTGEGSVLNSAVPAATDADGEVESYALVTDVAKGTLTFNSDGTYRFDPDGDFDALDDGDSEQVTFTYRAVDNGGGESAPETVTITVTGFNEAPIAADDARSTDENTAVSGTVGTSDADGTVVSHALVSGVDKGSLIFLEDGSWSFDPNGEFDDLDAGENEQVTFTYRATDNDGARSETKTVTITVTGVDAANVAPVATDGSASTSEDSILSGSVPAATDADGTIAGYALVSDVARGDLTFNSDGTYSFNPDGDFDALDDGESEQVTFTYRATDNDGAQSAVKTVTITVTGVDPETVAPVATDGSAGTDENTAVSGTVGTSDADGTVVSHALVSDVAKGALTFLEDGSWSFDPNGEFEALNSGESEQVAFTYRATDNDGAQSAAKTVTITVTGVDAANVAPVITSASAFKVAENTTAVAGIMATDADGDTPVFSIASGADAFLFKIDASTGALSFKSAPDFEEPGDSDGNNVYEVAVRASDGAASDTETLTITVTDEDGVVIKGSKKKDVVNDGTTAKGQPTATGEEDTITGKGGNDKLHGAGGNDRIDGGKGNDKLFGDEGDDWLVGGKGNDKLTGGVGEDSFVFNYKLKDNLDKVKDFETGIDTIVLDAKVFKKLSPGPLAVEEFVLGKKAKDELDHVIYNRKQGLLLYDQDGKGGKDASIFAKIGKGLDLDAGDFLVI